MGGCSTAKHAGHQLFIDHTDTEDTPNSIFRFTVAYQQHEVKIAHKGGVWTLTHDDVTHPTLRHPNNPNQDESYEMNFDVPIQQGQALPAAMIMSFQPMQNTWKYECIVNEVNVPACWTRKDGNLQ